MANHHVTVMIRFVIKIKKWIVTLGLIDEADNDLVWQGCKNVCELRWEKIQCNASKVRQVNSACGTLLEKVAGVLRR